MLLIDVLWQIDLIILGLPPFLSSIISVLIFSGSELGLILLGYDYSLLSLMNVFYVFRWNTFDQSDNFNSVLKINNLNIGSFQFANCNK